MKKKWKWGMFEGASHIIFQRARELRNNLTPAEMALWLHLRHGIMGYKFRRQHPIGAYIADFCCFKTKLIPDIKELDQARQNDLEELGPTIVIRFLIA